ncbi:leucyl/phenylalanyl-tRNA--protein transferase [Maricaulis virginensis]|mgnify:FL=1|uniref:Leucyl/phenylalanyl-tRNA--protein transferase n=1 Tax=Maricaulis virginensis TaxID=144022 RepID=A0A9W6MQF0_9PROT|nr:leucyl/phenylalanyl-tRNA--protein transferase [Maricaulis virginensis]GLK53906.1 leucyl/phenylalanyl-tRNA--protein transferase [Maricaulis virginensis]
MRGFGAEDLIECYARGVFPMAEGRDDPRIYLLDPDERGVLPLEGFHIPRTLRKAVRQDTFDIRFDTAFEAVVAGCAEPAPGREETWINDGILSLYRELFQLGFAHSVESWQDGELAGGLYGVSLGGAFFGESMFSRRTDASKVALVHLVAQLKAGGFILLDTQFTTEHLERFGAITIPREMYHLRLADALKIQTGFPAVPEGMSGAQALQSITQTS